MKTPNLKITYNPFTVKTQFELNGSLVNAGSLCEWSENRRLQQWVDKIFLSIFNDFNTNEIELTFEGLELDAVDVRDAVRQFRIENTELHIFDEYKTYDVSVDEKVSQLKDLFERAQEGPFDELRSERMHDAFAKALAPEIEVSVLATMSAGKSTLINAILGKELMPAKNEACTATISKIFDHDTIDHFEARRYGINRELLDDWTLANLDLIDEWNASKDTQEIEIKGNIPTINEREGVRLVLVDTPGPNNSRDMAHRNATIHAIRSKQPSMVLYVLNATQLSTDDDKDLLILIKEAMAEGGREAQDRFIFVANKIDCFDPEKGESIVSALKNVRDYLIGNGIANPLVIPASSELAKLIRMSEFEGLDSLSRKQRGSLNTYVELFLEESDMNMLMHVKNDIDGKIYSNLKSKLDSYLFEKNGEKAVEILSGIPIVEALLDNYISKHAVPSRLKDAVDTFKGIAAQTEAIKKQNEIIESGTLEIERITTAIETFKTDQKRIRDAQEFRERVGALKYSMSPDTVKRRKEIDRKINMLLDEFSETFKRKIKPYEAEIIIKKAERSATSLVAEIQELLADDLQKELAQTLTNLRAEYQKYVSELLDRSFPNSKEMKLIREFQEASLQMSDVKELIQNATVEESSRVFVGTERHGFLWLKKRDVYKTVYEDFVDMSGPENEIEVNLQEAKQNNFKSFEVAVKANLESAKKALLLQMDIIDSKFEETVLELKKASVNKKSQEKMIKDCKDKIDWFNQFTHELDEILAIKK